MITDVVSEMTYNVSSGTLNTTIPYHTMSSPNKRTSEVIFVHQNLTSNWLTYRVHAESTGELIIFGFSDRSVRSLVSAKHSANRWDQTKKRLHFLASLVSVRI